MNRYDELREACENVNVRVARWSPGDGVTRYRFFNATNHNQENSYFESDGDFTALGIKEATAYARGKGARI